MYTFFILQTTTTRMNTKMYTNVILISNILLLHVYVIANTTKKNNTAVHTSKFSELSN